MTPPTLAAPARANLTGAAWMTAAMAGFAVEDALVKTLAGRLPPGQAVILLGLGGAAVFALVARLRRERLFGPEVRSPVMLLRAAFEVTGRLFYVLALALTPLSATTAILQATPVVVVLGAALAFGERVGRRRWAAVLVGLAGVLVILRPTPDAFTPLSLLAVAGMLGFAGRDLASRAAPASLGTAALGFHGFVAMAAAGALLALWEGRAFTAPDATTAAALAATVAVGVCAYAALMTAMRTGEIAAVAPFRYTRILFGLGLGVALFGEAIDATLALGCAVVVAAGLSVLPRGRR